MSIRPNSKPRIIWQPLPGSQALAVAAPVNHILYEGTRGPGKTDCQLMRFRSRVGQGYGQYWRGIIFDKHYKSLDDLIAKSKKWFHKFNDGAKFLSGKSDLKWVWPTGEELLFRVIEKPSDYDKYHGHEYPFIGWNELTKWATSECYDVMMSTNRSSFLPEEHSPDLEKPLPRIPLEVFSTTNPWGVGHNWVKRRFINKAAPGRVVRTTTRVFNPQTQKEEDIVKTQVRIFGSYRENRYLDPGYIADLTNIADPNKRKAWLAGDWDVTSGGALDGVWRKDKHVLPRFPIPSNWTLKRTFDWGSTHPFSVGFWAISPGEEVEISDGVTKFFPKGTAIRIDEIYGSKVLNKERFGHNQGLVLPAREVAVRIKDKINVLQFMGWTDGEIRPGPADNQIHDVREKETNSIAKLMKEEGIEWEKSDKSKGTRKTGLELLRNALTNVLKHPEKPGFYVMENCEAWIETVPTLPRDEDDPDDVDTNAEDHPYDETRYLLLDDKPVYAGSVNVTWQT